MTGYIYKYENQINHKVYIGQTVDLAARKSSHISKSRTVKSKFYNAVRKYGWDSFDYSVIAQVEAEDIKELSALLDSLEEQYIEQYDSYENGYNSTTGGLSCREKQMPEGFSEECRTRAKAYSDERIKKLLEGRKKYVLTDEHRQRLSESAKRRNFAQYRELTNEKRVAGIKKALGKHILQIDADNNVVNEFESIRDTVAYIREFLAPNRAEMGIWKGIYRHINGLTKKRVYYGFEWKLKPNV